jgi:uncharacterized protein YprB with RNaseH-like and TPR domain
MESLEDKLKSLGVKRGLNSIQPSVVKQTFGIEHIVQGYDFITEYGIVFVTNTNYPKGYKQGSVVVAPPRMFSLITEWAGLVNLAPTSFDHIAFIDTETTGLAGGTGTLVFMIGIGHMTDQGFCVTQLFMRNPGDEPALFAALSFFLQRFNIIVSFNGRAFDIPILKSRHIQNSLDSPFEKLIHIDLLPLARRLWRDRLTNRALKVLEEEILKMQRTIEEIPGWMIPGIYTDYLITGDAHRLSGVFYHNSEDIISLAALFIYIADMLTNPDNVCDLPAIDIVSMAKLFEQMGYYDRAAIMYENGLTKGLPIKCYIDTLERYALMHRKQRNWEAAISVWQCAARHKHISACVELAKYYEHQVKDYREALCWTDIGIGLTIQENLNLFEKRKWITELESRQKRLYKRISKG